MSNYSIFSVLGVEIEYMLVDRDSYNIKPKSNLILKALKERNTQNAQSNIIEISHELVSHVIELKNNEPQPPNNSIAEQFQKFILNLQPILQEQNLVLMPSGAHPWMNPSLETVHWPYDNHDIYQKYNAIFNCKGHGWANLQSMHVNLPYSTDEEFSLLHNSIRLILPLLPSLAASTPILEGKETGLLDSRLLFYEKNQCSIPSICGELIPDFIKTEEEYIKYIINPMYEDIRPYDPEGLLQYSWLNSRGAIPKFDVKAIEIRILDTQECVIADIAIAKIILAILKNWCLSSTYFIDNPCETQCLKRLFDKSIRTGFSTLVEDIELIKQWQLPKGVWSIRKIWSHLIEKNSFALEFKEQKALEYILTKGNLSERILKSPLSSLKDTYKQLTICLITNQQF
jgi:gamma-glutamyl:cysteine ligase YbdK (ATP-grasp superfamily)